MAQDDPGNVTDTQRRFEIYVPSPKARINLGAPNKDSTGPFGYTGLSLQSDVHLFIDCNKHTLFQTGQNYCGQVGGKWLQYSNSDMIMSSTTNVNLSAEKKIVIASGAGQGQITAIDHGSTPRIVNYNSLELHYRVDRLQSSLFEFFHGRRKRNEYTGALAAVLKFGGASTEYFDGKGKASSSVQTETLLRGGFAWVSADSLRELYPVASKRAVHDFDSAVQDDGDPVALLDPFVHKKVLGGSKVPKDLKYGFSSYLSRFDPYSLTNTSKISHPIAKGLASFRNLLANMRRFADVCTKYAYLLTDNFLMKRAQAAMGAVDNLWKATSGAYRFVDLTFGAFLPGGSDGMLAELQDEKNSGMMARVATASSGLDSAGQEARDKTAKTTAKIQSNRGDFDLTGATSLTIQWGDDLDHSVTIDLTQGRDATRAELSLTISGEALLALPVSVRIDLAALSGGVPVVPTWIPEGDIVAWVASVLSVSAASVSGATGSAVDVYPPAATVRTLLATPAAITSLTKEFASVIPTPGTGYDPMTGQPWSTTAVTATLTLGSFVTLSVQRPTESFRLSVDGTSVTVSVDTSAVDPLDAASVQSAIYSALTSGIGTSATVSAMSSSGGVTITSGKVGSSSRIVVLDGSEALLGGVGLDVGQEAVGEDAVAGLGSEDLASVSAERLAQLIGSNSKLSVSTTGGTITLTSKYAATSAKPSKVKVSGAVADAVFGTQENTVTIDDVDDDAQDLAEADAEYKTLISWNHELQKLPEDTRNLTRPIRNAVDDVVSTMSSLEKAAENAMEFVGGDMKGLPSPPEAIGLIADQGITLGTRDRIVGVGGKGVVFIADGGSGDENHAKFIPKIEQFVNLSLSWDPLDRKLSELLKDKKWVKEEKKRPKSLGFRVLSDSHVDLFATHVAQLMALGRGKLSAAGPDGKTIVGTGVARLAGSHAAEIAGYRKVVVSARNRGDDDKTGGRVELAGQTIAIGGMNIAGDTKDFDHTKDTLFGIAPLDVDSFAGAEHLEDEEKEALKKEFATYAWPETLRDGGAKGHPDTQRVFVHAAKESVIQVGTYYIHVDAENGVTVGTRTADADPTANVIDDTKPSIQITPDKVRVSMGQLNKDSTLVLEKDSVLLFEGPTKDLAARAQLALKKGVATLYGGNSFFEAKQGKLAIYADNLDTSKTKNVKLTASGTIKIG